MKGTRTTAVILCWSVSLVLSKSLLLSSDDSLQDALSSELEDILSDELSLPPHFETDESLQNIQGSGYVLENPQVDEDHKIEIVQLESKESTETTTTDAVSTIEADLIAASPTTPLSSSIASSMESSAPLMTTSATSSAPPVISAQTTKRIPESTTRRISVESYIIKETPSRECVQQNPCLSDKECVTGRCRGALLGRCNCNACKPKYACSSDSQCGGLRGACLEGICQCSKALFSLGFPLLVDSILSFCNRKQCLPGGDDCLGLPCNQGYCLC